LRSCDVDVQCHAHNDFGLGLANALAGLRAGARYFHATVNGIGERAGMADLAQAVVTLKRLYGVDLGVDLTALGRLSDLVAAATSQATPPWQPVVGHNVFAHESGIHAKGMLTDTSTFEPFSPDLVGGERRFVLGKHSGRALVKWVLEEEGVSVRDDVLQDCLDRVRGRSIELAGAVPPSELVEIYREILAAAPVSG
jgi:isopropylmalate/homocitrate/citramalate synthase